MKRKLYNVTTQHSKCYAEKAMIYEAAQSEIVLGWWGG